MKSVNYLPQEAKIVERKILSADVVNLKLKINNFSFYPGQFIMVSVLGFGEIPISISSSPKEKGFIEIAVRSQGMVSKKIYSLEVGDTIGIRGPFGNGFPIAKIKNRDLILISGGTGLAPLRSLIKLIEKDKKAVRSLTILNGSRSPENLLYQEEYSEWRKFARMENTVDTCNKDWSECVGLVTKLYDKIKVEPGSVIISCGPQAMYQSIVDRFAGKAVTDHDIYFMLERNMKCGVGKCQHCTCGKLYTCLDGPVFTYDQLKYNSEAF